VLAESDVERVRGIEPLYEAWEAAVLPLNYTRINGYSIVPDPVFRRSIQAGAAPLLA
jgi:hypothetical protein